MFKALQQHAEKHAMFYLITIGFGLQAFGTSFYDNFYNIPPPNMADLGWWQVLALVLKSMSFAVGIMVGYLIKPPPKEVITESDTVSQTTTVKKTISEEPKP